jgi:hypothetical protein
MLLGEPRDQEQETKDVLSGTAEAVETFDEVNWEAVLKNLSGAVPKAVFESTDEEIEALRAVGPSGSDASYAEVVGLRYRPAELSAGVALIEQCSAIRTRLYGA